MEVLLASSVSKLFRWAEAIKAMDSKTAQWIAKDAIKELQSREVNARSARKKP